MQILVDTYLASAKEGATEEQFVTWLHAQGHISTHTYCGALVAHAHVGRVGLRVAKLATHL